MTGITTISQPIPVPYETYRHYKGGEYLVLSVANHTETKELMVVYVSLAYGTIWTRPLEIWNQFVHGEDQSDGRLYPRFSKIQRSGA
jgi:hypothetical protein